MFSLDKRGRVYLLTLTGDSEHRLSPDAIASLRAALARIRSESSSSPGGSALVTCAEGKFFSNGFDLGWARSGGASPAEAQRRLGQMVALFAPAVADLLSLPMPTVAAVTGHAAAAGLMLALSHDYVFMREDRGVLYMSELDIGLPFPPYFMSLMRAKIPGPRSVRDLTLRAAKMPAAEAVKRGIVDRALPGAGETVKAAVKLAEELAARKWDGEVYASIRMGAFPDLCRAVGLEDDEVNMDSGSKKLQTPSPLDNENLLAELLSRLDEGGLARMRCVCRHWHRLISSSYFRRLHRHKKLKHPMFLGMMWPDQNMLKTDEIFRSFSVDVRKSAAHGPVQSTRAPDSSAWPRFIELLSGSVQEFVVLEREQGLYLLYPSTGELRQLPEPSPRIDGEGDGYVLVAATHNKLARFFYRPDAKDHRRSLDRGDSPGPMSCEVLIINSSGTTSVGWREVAPPPFNISGDIPCVDGVAYGLAKYMLSNASRGADEFAGGITGPDNDKPILLAFDMDKEEYRPQQHPQALFGPDRAERWREAEDLNLKLISFEGMLGIVDYNFEGVTTWEDAGYTRLDMWLLISADDDEDRDGGVNHLWERRYVVNLDRHFLWPIGLTDDGQLLLTVFGMNWYCRYDPVARKLSAIFTIPETSPPYYFIRQVCLWVRFGCD